MAKKLEGNGLWQSSRMVLPEHVKAIVQYQQESETDKLAKLSNGRRPPRDEFEMEAIGEQLAEAKREGATLSLTVWGASDPVVGRIAELDARIRQIHVEKYGAVTKVPFMDVMRVEYPR